MPIFETPSERMEFFDYAVQERRTHAYGPDNAEHDTRDGVVVLRFFTFRNLENGHIFLKKEDNV